MAEAQLTNQLTRIDSMTCVELRAELKQRGCATSGNKKDLIAKLRNALQNDFERSRTQLDLPINDQATAQHPSVLNLTIPQNVNPSLETIPSTPEKITRARSKNPSVDSTSLINNEEIVLDTSTNDNNVEVTPFVSKSNEEKEKDIGESNSLSIDSSSAKLESIVKEIPLSDEQQRLDQSESISATNVSNDDIKIPNEVIDQASNVNLPADLKSPLKEQQETIKEAELSPVKTQPEKPAPQQQLKPSLSQISSFMKGVNRSTNNKINLTSEMLKTLIPDISLAPESDINDELDESMNEPLLETNVGNDLLISNSMTIGELADQKQQTNRTVVMDVANDSSVLNDDLNGRKKQSRVPSFESKTLLNGKSNTIVTDEPVRIKDVTVAQEPLSQILYIRGLTRPFSLFQIKGLLGRYGTLVDGEFWLDKIKSQCFVTYNTSEEAQNAREALDGCRWPSTNPKTLSVRFARQDEFEFSKTHDLPPEEMSIDSIDRIIQEKTNVISSRRSTSPVDKNNHWDVSKSQEEIKSGFLISDAIEEVKTNEPSVKGLDDYFRKTKAKPSIYWLPLTDEQTVERIRRQEQRNAERDEEQKKRESYENNQRSNSKSHRSSPTSQEKRKNSSSPSRRKPKRH